MLICLCRVCRCFCPRTTESGNCSREVCGLQNLKYLSSGLSQKACRHLRQFIQPSLQNRVGRHSSSPPTLRCLMAEPLSEVWICLSVAWRKPALRKHSVHRHEGHDLFQQPIKAASEIEEIGEALRENLEYSLLLSGPWRVSSVLEGASRVVSQEGGGCPGHRNRLSEVRRKDVGDSSSNLFSFLNLSFLEIVSWLHSAVLAPESWTCVLGLEVLPPHSRAGGLDHRLVWSLYSSSSSAAVTPRAPWWGRSLLSRYEEPYARVLWGFNSSVVSVL